jgi:hypothetical protein
MNREPKGNYTREFRKQAVKLVLVDGLSQLDRLLVYIQSHIHRMKGTSPSRGCGGSRESASTCHDEVLDLHQHQQEGKSMPIVAIGIDLARMFSPFTAWTRLARRY